MTGLEVSIGRQPCTVDAEIRSNLEETIGFNQEFLVFDAYRVKSTDQFRVWSEDWGEIAPRLLESPTKAKLGFLQKFEGLS